MENTSYIFAPLPERVKAIQAELTIAQAEAAREEMGEKFRRARELLVKYFGDNGAITQDGQDAVYDGLKFRCHNRNLNLVSRCPQCGQDFRGEWFVFDLVTLAAAIEEGIAYHDCPRKPATPSPAVQIHEAHKRLTIARNKFFDDQLTLKERRAILDNHKAEAFRSGLYKESASNEDGRKIWLADYLYPDQAAVDEAENISSLSRLELEHATDDWSELKMFTRLVGGEE